MSPLDQPLDNYCYEQGMETMENCWNNCKELKLDPVENKKNL